MVLAAARRQQRLVGRVLDQRMPEDVGAVPHPARGKHYLRTDQPFQSGRNSLFSLVGDGAQQLDLELPPDHRGQPGELFGLAAEPVQPRQRRRLKCFRNIAAVVRPLVGPGIVLDLNKSGRPDCRMGLVVDKGCPMPLAGLGVTSKGSR
jgi:hypothetical protein